jgi:hypothetical protein
MAVRANHIALRDLIKDRSPAPPADASGDIKFLLAEMIELEDDRIGLAAVGAWMCTEVVNEKRRPLRDERVSPTNRGGNVALSICDVVRSFVSSTAWTAVRVECSKGSAVPRKLRGRLHVAAAAATAVLLVVRHERTFP